MDESVWHRCKIKIVIGIIVGIKHAQYWVSLWRKARQISLDYSGFPHGPHSANNTEQIWIKQIEL